MKPAALRAVFFDVGGTLIHPWPSVGAIYAEVAQRHGVATDAEQMEHTFHESWRALKQPGLTVSRKEWWRQLVFRTLGQESDACFEELFERFARPDAWRVYPDALDALRVVREHRLHVGIISNWDRRLRPLLAGLGIASLVDSMTISCEAGAEKPDPRIFQMALAAGCIEPYEALHIGDSQDEDVRGAEAVGMQGRQVERGRPGSDLVTLVSAALSA